MASDNAWDLVAPDATVFGRLELKATGSDMFWSACTFAPTPAFGAVEPLFAEERALLEREEMDAWEIAYERIAALGLVLHPVGGGAPIREFLLHIEGGDAELRY